MIIVEQQFTMHPVGQGLFYSGVVSLKKTSMTHILNGALLSNSFLNMALNQRPNTLSLK